MVAATAAMAGGLATPANAYLFWNQPNFAGQPGAETTLVPLTGANAKETAANKLWSMRAGLNVAALQCQFAPALMTVRNYNDVLKHHAAEFNATYAAIAAYFKRTGGSSWQSKLDQYTTRTYNGYSTMHAQMGFCEEAGALGRGALAMPKGKLTDFAGDHIGELRNSLSITAGDSIYAVRPPEYAPVTIDPICTDRRGRTKPCA